MNYICFVLIIHACSFQLIDCTKPNCGLYKNSYFSLWGTDCGRFCHQRGKRVTCAWYHYHMGCLCADGFYRNREWDCVPWEGCDSDFELMESSELARPNELPVVTVTKQCPPGEVWQNCGNLCFNLCESVNNKEACQTTKCDQGCFCANGLLRNYNGACVKQQYCKNLASSSSTKFEYSKSVSLSIYIKKYWWIISGESSGGEEGKGGTGKPSKGKGDKCTVCEKPTLMKEKCKKYEEYSTCGDTCSEQCRNMYTSENCPLTCQIGCFCKQHYYRNNNGVCVPERHCIEYIPDAQQETTTTGRPPPDYDPDTVTKRPERNVSDDECPPNEKPNQCGSHCQELCENANYKHNCPPNMNCMSGCFCKEGHYRNRTDACVPKSSCGAALTTPKPPVQCKINEHYTKCGSKCSESCSVFDDLLTSVQSCPPKCDEGCFCIQGFYRDTFDQCVPQEQCECSIPPQQCRDKNEEYLVCGKNCRDTCDLSKRDCKETCARGCFCKQGYVYNENGVCVRPNQCGLDIRNGTSSGKRQIVRPGAKCPGEHEKYSKCGNLCLDFCEPTFDVKNCPMTCEKGCICKRGYKRNSADQCVKIEQCGQKPVCGKNQVYSTCGSNCGHRCKDIGRDVQCPLKCDKGCFCINGYFRDDNNECIPRSTCVIDTTPECGKHEVYRNCSSHCGQTCEDLLNPVECPKDECDSGCFCEEDYYRDIDGVCGTKLDCDLPATTTESRPCEDNEVRKECGNRCEESCEDSIKCSRTCEAGCFCLDDYLRNKKGKCVESEKCKGPPQCTECKPSEYWTDCGTDCGRMCTDLNKKIKPVCAKDTPCHGGCLCKFGFFRTPDGECVTQNECQFYIDEDEEEIEYITTVDPDDLVVDPTKGGQGGSKKKKAAKKTKPKSFSFEHDQVDYPEHPEHSQFNSYSEINEPESIYDMRPGAFDTVLEKPYRQNFDQGYTDYTLRESYPYEYEHDMPLRRK